MKKNTDKPDPFWNWIARLYDRQTHKDQDYDRAVRRFSKYLKANDTVLDYACGTGVVAFKIAAYVKQVDAVDTSARMISVGSERAGEHQVANVQFAQKSIFDEGLARESYDVVLAFNILHLVDDARAVLRQACALLKPNGLLISSTPCVGDAGPVMRNLLPVAGRVIGLSYLRSLQSAEVKELIRGAGFRILETEIRGGKIKLYYVVAQKS